MGGIRSWQHLLMLGGVDGEVSDECAFFSFDELRGNKILVDE